MKPTVSHGFPWFPNWGTTFGCGSAGCSGSAGSAGAGSAGLVGAWRKLPIHFGGGDYPNGLIWLNLGK